MLGSLFETQCTNVVCALDAQRQDHRVVVMTIVPTDVRETETAVVAVRARDVLNSSFRRCCQIYADHDSGPDLAGGKPGAQPNYGQWGI